MRRYVLVVAACLLFAPDRHALGSVITFTSPDLALGTCETQVAFMPGFFYGRLRVWEEGGVHVEVSNNYPPLGNDFLVDCRQPVRGLGLIVDPPPVGPFSMFAVDQDRIAVTSLTGDAIRRIRIGVTDYFNTPNTCDPLVFSLGFSICDFSGDLFFADYGFPNGVTSFTMRYVTDNYDGIAVLRAIETPEPMSSALLAVGLAATVRRLRRRSERVR